MKNPLIKIKLTDYTFILKICKRAFRFDEKRTRIHIQQPPYKTLQKIN